MVELQRQIRSSVNGPLPPSDINSDRLGALVCASFDKSITTIREILLKINAIMISSIPSDDRQFSRISFTLHRDHATSLVSSFPFFLSSFSPLFLSRETFN